jgi:diguanylate cyclase (GGDEF)-like protein
MAWFGIRHMTKCHRQAQAANRRSIGMKKRSRAFSAPETQSDTSGNPIDVRRLAARTAVSMPSSEESLKTILETPSEPAHQPPAVSGYWAQKELECARAFNFDLPNDPLAALDRLEDTLRRLMNVTACAVLTFNEQTGVYTCLDDLRQPGNKVREITRISDWFLQELFGAGHDILHSDLLSENGLAGLIVISKKHDGRAFHAEDQLLLDVLAPYLALQVERLQHLKDALAAPYTQGVALELAEKLLTAVDQDSIFPAVLETLTSRLGLNACQYVALNPETGTGEILYEIKQSGSQAGGPKGKVHSYSHAGLEAKRRSIEDFANLIGLLGSLARNRTYLQLNGKKLGERSLGEIFGVRNIQSALLVPITDMTTGEIRGTLNMFHTSATRIGDESREIGLEAARLTSAALSRAAVLEKALAMASSDELTHLINRRGYYQRFEAELERARRHQTPLCVALIDVDHFKNFNDTYGHLSGDLVLKTLADLFIQNIRKSDVVCRFGGEEFAVLLPDTSLKAATDLMERVRHSVEKRHIKGFHGERLKVTISIGVVEVDTKPKAKLHCSDISDALARADEQLYAAKNSGRNQVRYASLNDISIPNAG